MDHVGFAVRELAPLLACMRTLGFSPTEPRPLLGGDPGTGQTRALGQDSAHLVLHEGYIELTAVPDPAAGNHLEAFLRRYQGLHILALHADDPAQARQRLLDAGLSVTALAHASRPIEYGERTGSATFTWCMVDPDGFDAGLLCVMRGHTPELVYQSAVQRHHNTAFALRGVTLLTADVERMVSVLSGLTGQAPRRDGDAWIVPLRAGELRAYSLEDAPDSHASTVAGRTACISGLIVSVRELAPLQRLLEQRQVDFDREGDSLLVSPAEAGCPVLEFSAAAADLYGC
ncbi:MAG: VOC family protein [Gammaproteobacteria bacterium]|nr:VOC family protein [Gammaproteobacteria bacterium]